MINVPLGESKLFCVGFVLFNEGEKFIRKIELLLDLGYSIYLYDNSPNKKRFKDFKNYSRKNSIKYFTSGKNIGLSIALSTLCSNAFYDGYTKLLFFDQDSIFSAETLSIISNHFVKNFYDNYIALSITNEGVEKKDDSLLVEDVLLIRNSGTVFFLENLSKLKWFNHKYFVDYVDYELCFRSSLNKYKIGKIKNVKGFDHVTEQGYLRYQFFGIDIYNRKYSFSRIKEIIQGSVRLMFQSLYRLKLKYFMLLSKNFFGFVSIQILIRLSKLKENK